MNYTDFVKNIIKRYPSCVDFLLVGMIIELRNGTFSRIGKDCLTFTKSNNHYGYKVELLHYNDDLTYNETDYPFRPLPGTFDIVRVYEGKSNLMTGHNPLTYCPDELCCTAYVDEYWFELGKLLWERKE